MFTTILTGFVIFLCCVTTVNSVPLSALPEEITALRAATPGQFLGCPAIASIPFAGKKKTVKSVTYNADLQRCIYTLGWDSTSPVIAWSFFGDATTALWDNEVKAWRKLGLLAGTTKMPHGEPFQGASFMAIKLRAGIHDPTPYFNKSWSATTISHCRESAAKIPQLVYNLYKSAAEKGLSPSSFDHNTIWFNNSFTQASFVAFPSPKTVNPKDATKIATQAKAAAAIRWNPTICHASP